MSRLDKQLTNCKDVANFLDRVDRSYVDVMRELASQQDAGDDRKAQLAELLADLESNEAARLELTAAASVLGSINPLLQQENVPSLKLIFEQKLANYSGQWQPEAVRETSAYRDAAAVLVVDEDAEIMTEAVQTNLHCPFTKKRFQHPVRSKKCRHTYEKAVAEKLASKKKLSCPVTGCGYGDVMLSLNDLEDDKAMMRQLKVKAMASQSQTQTQTRLHVDDDDDSDYGGGGAAMDEDED